MKFDTIIIGGGLTGLCCGISLQLKGQHCAIISTGQSALHFSSGSFDLLNRLPDGSPVDQPLEAIRQLPETHPYHKFGDTLEHYVEEAQHLLVRCGISVKGDASKNSFRFTPMGELTRTWLTLSELAPLYQQAWQEYGKTAIVNFEGFLDFNAKFISSSFQKQQVEVQMENLKVENIERLRKSPTEMRASNIAHSLDAEETFDQLVEELKKLADRYDTFVLPAVLGVDSWSMKSRLTTIFKQKIQILPTMPPSVPGIRVQRKLRQKFESLGGSYLLGDTVLSAESLHDRITSVRTVNLQEASLRADHFVLASGHFFSGGLVANMSSVMEPVFKADVSYLKDRKEWCSPTVLGDHPYSRFGIETDDSFRVRKDGRTLENLYGAGAILGGASSMTEGSGAGISMTSALRVADKIWEQA